jgi:catechol-2,3-dioxygenase
MGHSRRFVRVRATSGYPSKLTVRVHLHCADLGRAGDFYGRLFGTEIASAAPGRSRVFGLGDSVLELISAPANAGPATRELDYIRVAVKDFSVETATRVLRERGNKDRRWSGSGIAAHLRSGRAANRTRSELN